MANKKTKVTYAEPNDYFPKDIRKKYKLGEFAEDEKPKKATQKTPAKKKVKRK